MALLISQRYLETVRIRRQMPIKEKMSKKEVVILKKKYEDDLLVEINEDGECIGREAFDSMVHTEYVHDEETGEEVKKTSTKTITESTIDP